MAVRASRTSSSLNGLMIAITIFMGPIPAWARSRHDRAFSTEVSPRGEVRYAGTAEPIESNAVPDRPRCLTVYERGCFEALPDLSGYVPFGHAQNIITSDQNISR